MLLFFCGRIWWLAHGGHHEHPDTERLNQTNPSRSPHPRGLFDCCAWKYYLHDNGSLCLEIPYSKSLCSEIPYSKPLCAFAKAKTLCRSVWKCSSAVDRGGRKDSRQLAVLGKKDARSLCPAEQNVCYMCTAWVLHLPELASVAVACKCLRVPAWAVA